LKKKLKKINAKLTKLKEENRELEKKLAL